MIFKVQIKEQIQGIESLETSDLIRYFENAVCDKNYNPSSSDYNQSGFSYDELKQEIYRRTTI